MINVNHGNDKSFRASITTENLNQNDWSGCCKSRQEVKNEHLGFFPQLHVEELMYTHATRQEILLQQVSPYTQITISIFRTFNGVLGDSIFICWLTFHFKEF